MILAGTVSQRTALTDHLESQGAAGRLFYGIHASPSSLMTCLIFNRDGEHVHFVDGRDGGGSMAAVMMKQQMSRESGSNRLLALLPTNPLTPVRTPLTVTPP